MKIKCIFDYIYIYKELQRATKIQLKKSCTIAKTSCVSMGLFKLNNI